MSDDPAADPSPEGPGGGPDRSSDGPGGGPDRSPGGPGGGPDRSSEGPGGGPDRSSEGPGGGPDRSSEGPGGGPDRSSEGPGGGPDRSPEGPGGGPASSPDAAVDDLVGRLGLERHPEGGWFRRVWTAAHPAGPDGDRRAASAIRYLLGPGDVSAWHRLLDAEEVWFHQAGTPMLLRTSPDGVTERRHLLGPDLAAGHEPSVVVPVGHWQSAEPLATATAPSSAPPSAGPLATDGPQATDEPQAAGPSSGDLPPEGAVDGWSLVACVVSPEFRFEGFELAPPCWEPGGDQV